MEPWGNWWDPQPSGWGLVPLMRKKILIALTVAWGLAAGIRPVAEEHPLLQAMRDEMARSMAGLRMKDQPPPYYIADTVDDVATSVIRAALGAPVEDNSFEGRVLRVEVRVGSYDFDSSRFLSYEREAGVMPAYVATGGMTCTLDDDEDAVGRQIWLMTDAAYKHALRVFAKKQAAFQNRAESDKVPDFSRETPVEAVRPPAPAGPLDRSWVATVSRLSAVFQAEPRVTDSEAGLTVRRGTRYLLTSEGFKIVSPIASAAMIVRAETQAGDGMRLRDSYTAVESRVDDLPAADQMRAEAERMRARLLDLARAPVAEEYSGPVLVEGQASAELVGQALVPLFLSQRAPESDTPRGDLLSRSGSPYLTRIGARVVPEFLSVADTPSLARFEGRPVAGAYDVDDEGIRAQDVTLVKDGKLLTLLTSRTPQKRLLVSNGHGRGGTAQAGVFQVTSSSGMRASALKARYLDTLKQQDRPFGFIVRRLVSPMAMSAADAGMDPLSAMSDLLQGGGQGAPGPRISEIVKVTADGREEPVRGLVFGEVTRNTFKDIVGASEERTLYNTRAVASGPTTMGAFFPGGGGEVTISLIVPNLLFDELELLKTREVPQKRPVVPAPALRTPKQESGIGNQESGAGSPR
jgi:hypothetical protein